jgi:hemoglobin
VKKTDIRGRGDIKLLVDRFYDKVRTDDMIAYIFTDVAKVNWDVHLPVMYDFWENVLFYTASYTGNPMIVHRKLNNIIALQPEHFERWLQLFHGVVDELFQGTKAELAKQRATSIATVMQLKIRSQD